MPRVGHEYLIPLIQLERSLEPHDHLAFDTRFAVVLIGSSGEGGAKLHRRNWGEAVENITGSGEYHWMAGNFLKYGASKASFGSKTAGAHDLGVKDTTARPRCRP